MLPRPTFMQRFFARNGPLWLYFICATCGGASMVLRAFPPSREMFQEWTSVAVMLMCMALAASLALLISLIPLWLALGPIYNIRARMNGAPFRIGEEVMVLAKAHYGEVGKIYDIWESRRQVRVSLGSQAAEDFSDVFAYFAVWRFPLETDANAQVD